MLLLSLTDNLQIWESPDPPGVQIQTVTASHGNENTLVVERKVQSIASDGSIVNRAEQIKYGDNQN